MANEFDALTQDVGIGGVRSRLGIRVLLCYILKNVKSEVSRTAFSEILRSSELVNFFEEFTEDEPKEDTERIVYVARKK